MTANQIAYAKQKEEVRTHQAQEAENFRHNVAYENEMNRGNTLNYQANIYASQVSARNAEIAADTQRYAAGLNYAANVYATDVNATTQRRQQNLNDFYNTQKLSQDSSRIAEEKRHNLEMENVQQQNATTQKWQVAGNFINNVVNAANTVKTAVKGVMPLIPTKAS